MEKKQTNVKELTVVETETTPVELNPHQGTTTHETARKAAHNKARHQCMRQSMPSGFVFGLRTPVFVEGMRSMLLDY